MRIRPLRALALLAFATGAQAQPAGNPSQIEPATPAENDRLATAILANVARGPSDRALGDNAVPEIELVASADEKIASLAWSFLRSAPSHDLLDFSQFSLRVATSLEDDGETELLGLGGFPGGTEVTLSFTRFLGGIGHGSEHEARILATAVDRCRQDPQVIQAQRVAACDPEHADFPGVSAFVERYNFEEFEEHYRGWFPHNVPFFGLSFSGNQDNYRYLDRPSFKLLDDSRFGYDATLFGGLLFIDSLTSLTGSFTYSRRYEAQGPVTLCQTINATQSQCLTGADGPPEAGHKAIVALELRHAFAAADGRSPPRLAIAPEISADLRNEEYSINVPIYFAPESAGGLRGGVRLNYTNRRADGGGRENEFTAGLFVGVPFRLFR